MLRLAVYETLQGEGSPNRWAQHASESSPVAWLLRGMRPSARACYRFRDRLGDVVEAIHNSIIQHEHAAQSFPDPEEVASNKRDFVWLDDEQTYQSPQGHQLEYQ